MMRIGFIADIQGNAVALEAVLAELGKLAIDQLVCLGDVASGPEPKHVLDLLQKHNALTIRGNMDDVILKPEPYTGTDEAEQRYAEMDAWCSTQLGDADHVYLESFSPHLTLNLSNGEQILACHGSPDSTLDVWTANQPDDDTLKSYFTTFGVKWIVVGHMHRPLLRCVEDYRLFNPGSVGLPPQSETGKHPLQADYAILETSLPQMMLRFGRVRYSGEAFKQRVLRSGLPHAEWFVSLWDIEK